MTVYEIFLENPVSVNKMYFQVPGRTGFRIPSKETKAFKGYWKGPKDKKTWVDGYASIVIKNAQIKPYSGTKKVVVEATCIWPDNRKRDCNNFAKICIDTLKECGVVPDDNIVLWREMDYWVEKGVFGIKLKIYESELAA